MILLILIGLLLIPIEAFAQVCSIQTTSTGWTWSCPQLPSNVGSVCKDAAEDGIDASSGHSVSGATLTSKYGSLTAWGIAQSARMLNEGITTAGQYAYTYTSYYPTNGVPYEPTEDMGGYLQEDRFSWHLKNQAWVINPNGMTCNNTGVWYQGHTPDDWDPNAQSDYNAIWADTGTPQSIYNGYPTARVRDYIPDDGDSLYVYDLTIHPDFGYVIAANSPVQAVSDGGGYTFPNATLYVKIGMVDYLAGKYGCVNAGTSITSLTESGYIATATVSNSFTAGEMVTISGATPSGYNNSGYPVLVMPEGLSSTQFQYVLPTAGLSSGSGATVHVVESPLVTTGTDPIGLSTCGSSLISSSLTALQTAWGTGSWPSTWGTSDSAGLSGIANNTYASWGTGTGLLDENGTHILSSSFKSTCGTQPPDTTQTWGVNATVQADLQQFIGIDGALHALRHRVGYNAVCSSNCPPLADLYYDSPNYVYQQASPYLDLVVISPSYYTTLAAAESRVQTIINNDAGMPIRVHNYTGVPATSGCDLTTQAAFCKTTESAVGTAEATFDADIVRDQNPFGKYSVLGFGHWMGYDWDNTSSSGIYTLKDNMYDGSNASTLSTCSATWAANHTYTLPSCITDGTNTEYLAIAGEPGASCTSGTPTHPTWATGYGALTYNDGTCIWDNGSTYTQVAESANSGNYLTPLIKFFTGQSSTGSICDPAGTPTPTPTPTPGGGSSRVGNIGLW